MVCSVFGHLGQAKSLTDFEHPDLGQPLLRLERTQKSDTSIRDLNRQIQSTIFSVNNCGEDTKLMQLEVRNRIVDDSDYKLADFGCQFGPIRNPTTILHQQS